MPPKKKKGKKAKKQPPKLIDEVDTSVLNEKELMKFILRLKADRDRQREDRNYFKLECVKLRKFWVITRQQLEQARIELHQKEREVLAAQNVIDIDTRTMNEQMMHCKTETARKIGVAYCNELTQSHVAKKNFSLQQQALIRDKLKVTRTINENNETFELQLQRLRMDHREKMSLNLIKFHQDIKDTESLYQEKFIEQKNKLTFIWRRRMSEVEKRKNLSIDKLIESHNKAFLDMKNYYNYISQNNFGLIGTLKEELLLLRKKAGRAEYLAHETLAVNRVLNDPNEQAKVQTAIQEAREELKQFDKNRKQLKRLQANNKTDERKLESLKLELDVLLMRNETLKKEREAVRDKFEFIVVELQRKLALKSAMLEHNIGLMQREDEKRDAIIKESLQKYGCETEALADIKSITTVIDEKDKEISDLKYKLSQVAKAHCHMLATFEAKMCEFGIPKEQLGFKPLRFSIDSKYLPHFADSISKN